MRKLDIVLAAILVPAVIAVDVQAAHRPLARPKPRAARPKPKATVSLKVGDLVEIDGQVFAVSYGLAQVGSAPTPSPLPTPTPTPTPSPTPGPVPNPTPAPDMTVYEYRDNHRNPATAFLPGTTVWIEGDGFGTAPGQVLINNVAVPTQSWTNTEIEIICPTRAAAGNPPGPINLGIVRSTGGSYYAMAFTIIGPPATVPKKPRRLR